MSDRVNLVDSTYSHCLTETLRGETFSEHFMQNSWFAAEYQLPNRRNR